MPAQAYSAPTIAAILRLLERNSACETKAHLEPSTTRYSASLHI